MSDENLDDALTRRILWSLPTGLYVLGSVENIGQGPWNLMTINLVTQVATEPRIIAFSVEVGSQTARFLKSSGVAALSVLARSDRSVVRKFVKPVSDVELNDEGVPVSLSGQAVALSKQGAPILDLAVASIGCVVVERQDFDSHSVFFGQVTDVQAVTAFSEGSASERRVEILRMEDTKMNYGG